MRLFICGIMSLFLFSCAVNQQITLNTDGSGRVESSVYMEDFFLGSLKDLTDLGQSGEDGQSRLEADSVALELAQNSFFSNIEVASPREGSYEGSLSFSHIEALFSTASGDGENPVISHRQLENGSHRLILRINDENFSQIFHLFPVLTDPGFQYFLPEEGISRQEYREMLMFIFEDGAEADVLEGLIDSASLNLVIKVDGRILEQEGGRLLSPDTLKIRLPLLDLLLHKEEILYSLTYR